MSYQTFFQGLAFFGGICVAVGLFGSYVFERRAEREKDAKEAYVGRLETDRKIILSAGQRIYPEIELGQSTSIFRYAGQPGLPLFKVAEDNDITIEMEDGQVMISTKILDRTGKMVAEISKNEWKVNPRDSWDRNYSKNALEVKDATGDIILQVRLVEDRVQFQAKLYDTTGHGVYFGESPTRGPGKGGTIMFIHPEHPEHAPKIRPIFKYPSDLHLGEFADTTSST